MNLTDERDTDLYGAYERKLKELGKYAPYVTRKAIAQLVVSSKAKKFYLSAETALKLISCIERTGLSGRGSPLSQRKAQDVYREYQLVCQAHPYLGKYGAVEKAVNSEAPQFYLDWDAALRIITKIEKSK